MDITQEELDRVKCLHKIKLEQQIQLGFTQVNPYYDSDCLTCDNYYTAIGNPCHHYINQRHIELFKKLFILD